MTLRVALSAGHHNNDGGSPLEKTLTGPLCKAYADAFRAAGADVRVITPNDGLGMFPGGLRKVAQKVVDWSKNDGWTADIFLETHTEGVSNTNVRGVFSIYPDWGSDVDQTVKNELGLKIATAISDVSGIPVREGGVLFGPGVMSRMETEVGSHGDRLGIFLVTAELAATTTRLIVEHGAHSSPKDLAILQTPGMLAKIAGAAVKVICDHFGSSVIAPIEPVIQINGFFLGHGFLDYWRQLDIQGLPHPLGLPKSEEQPWTNPEKKQLTIQVFERGVLSFDADEPDPVFRVQGLIIGPDWGKNHGVDFKQHH
ncbi:MAG: hypothetical protein JWP00_451 [Chloroflexi bacterium]|jgi:N-acetylmuramoyl-L-alanine amidase|nr:hypothetical protein [Chloroflexota bacterium]